ncbi:MAG: hypothetical protein EZS28_053087, partial [Streblomastix strix]
MVSAIQLAQQEQKTTTLVQQKLYPNSTNPNDFLTTLDVEGSFAESKDFFSRVGDEVLRDVMSDDDSLCRILVCAQFSEMLGSEPDSSGFLYISSNAPTGG